MVRMNKCLSLTAYCLFWFVLLFRIHLKTSFELSIRLLRLHSVSRRHDNAMACGSVFQLLLTALPDLGSGFIADRPQCFRSFKSDVLSRT